MSEELETIIDDGGMVDICGKKYRVVFGHKAMKFLSRKYGSLKKAIEIISDKDAMSELTEQTLDAIVDIVYSGICINSKELTPEAVEEMLGELGLNELLDTLMNISTYIHSAMYKVKGGGRPL